MGVIRNKRIVRAGFVALVDCAALVVAHEKGFAASQGIDLHLRRAPSWATLRDWLAIGDLDGAHLLAGLTLALHLGLRGVGQPMVAALSLGQGGNAITLAGRVIRAMEDLDPESMHGARPGRHRALERLARAARETGGDRLRLASVHPFSSHHYELREWLADGGIDPDEDVELVFIPPARMVESLGAGEIDGFCVGEPWNQLAVARGVGEIVVTKCDLWPAGPEKVLALRDDWRQAHAEVALALTRALIMAGRWADEPRHRPELARLLARPEYVNVDENLILACLEERPWLDMNQRVAIPGYHRFHAGMAQFPWRAQARWLLERMRRWGQIDAGIPLDPVISQVYDTRLYRQAAVALGDPLPEQD